MSSGSRVGLFMAALWFGGCHAPAKSAPSDMPMPASRAQLGQRCTELLGSRSASSVPPRRVLLEIARLTGQPDRPLPPLSSPGRSGPFDDPSLVVQSLTHIIVENEVPSTLPWDAPQSAPIRAHADAPQRWDLRLTARAETAGALRLEVDLAPAPPLGTPAEAWSIPEHRRVHTTVVVGEQQPVVLGLPAGAGAPERSLMVVMPYFIREEADLRRLFECKMRGHPRIAG
ncbi:MAG: hypothetical protein EOO73_24310 [Myxococcales bacterium]|nr:MAG: hypothetical protein EOO73_24310 [Myxococcales bacterium]